MTDTAFWVPDDKLDRLPAAYRPAAVGFDETEPAGGGFYAGPPPFDVSHAELVSTVPDFHRFLTALLAGDLVSPEHLVALRSDQTPASAKTAESFFPGFWDGTGWGFGVSVRTEDPNRGRFGWAGGQGTDFFVDPDATVGILFTQVEMGAQLWPLLQAFQGLRASG
jgi:CubicO group peptidase (beta-lactamase class C family)